jgi:hypothetical protein
MNLLKLKLSLLLVNVLLALEKKLLLMKEEKRKSFALSSIGS